MQFLSIEDSIESISYALSLPVIRASLSMYSEYAYSNLNKLISGKLCKDSKKGRKALRHLTIVMARAATRATPSRIIGRVGVASDELMDKQQNIFNFKLKDEWFIFGHNLESENIVDVPLEGNVRWNPSVVRAGEYYYLTMSRVDKIPPYSSLKFNAVLEFIENYCANAVRFGDLIDSLERRNRLVLRSAIEKSILDLIEKGFLLNDASGSIYSKPTRIQEIVRYTDNFDETDLINRVKEFDKQSMETRRDGSISLSTNQCNIFKDAYRTLVRYGLCQTMDQGMGKEFASILNEKYGYSKINLKDLMHPSTGIRYDGIVKALLKKKRRHELGNLITIASSSDTWVDLQQIKKNLSYSKESWNAPYDFSVPLMPVYDQHNHINFLACDGVACLPGNLLQARFASLTESVEGLVDPKGLWKSLPDDENKCAIDWTASRSSTNSVREFSHNYGRILNANAINVDGSEILPSDIWVRSNGDKIFFEDRAGRELVFEPQSMISMVMYPDWIQLLLIAATDSWPTMMFSWGELEEYYDSFPGIKFGNLIFSRPRYRYRGSADVDSFNTWCDEKQINRYIRLGKMDRKVLIDRKSPRFKFSFIHLLKSADLWVEDATCEVNGPVATSSSAQKNIYGEFVFTAAFEDVKATQAVSPIYTRGENIVESEACYLLPGFSETANLELVPRNGNVSALIKGISREIPSYKYFLRYFTDDGEPCIRLRILREDLNNFEVNSGIKNLYFDGVATDISEKIHRQEFERYGGPKAFCKFERLFHAESKWIAALAEQGALDTLTLMEKAMFVQAWLQILLDVANTSSFNTRINLNVHEKFKIKSFDALPMKSEWEPYSNEFRHVMKEIYQQIGDEPHPWQVGAHLWCNRLGISTEEERLIWTGRKL